MSPINASRARWSPFARAAWVAGSIYQFVRDENDRDLMRRLLIYGKAEDIKDSEKRLDSADKVALPRKLELKEAVDSLSKLSDEEWKEVMTADDKAWGLAKVEIAGRRVTMRRVAKRKWRKCMGIEPTDRMFPYGPTVLKTAAATRRTSTSNSR